MIGKSIKSDKPTMASQSTCLLCLSVWFVLSSTHSLTSLSRNLSIRPLLPKYSSSSIYLHHQLAPASPTLSFPLLFSSTLMLNNWHIWLLLLLQKTTLTIPTYIHIILNYYYKRNWPTQLVFSSIVVRSFVIGFICSHVSLFWLLSK